MLLGGFPIGRWLGFEIRIDWSWFVVFALVVWTFSAHEFPRQLPGYEDLIYYTMGVTGALVFFLSVLVHELAHATVARARGIEVEGITLFIFGGIARTRMEAERAIDEFLLTVVGPLSSLGLAGVFYGLASFGEVFGWSEPVVSVARYLALLNLILAVFNMVPGFPLDGGRIFRSGVWALTGDLEKATRWATRIGRGVGWLLIALGVVELFYGFVLAGLWAVFIGWFLSNAASASYRHFLMRRMLSRVDVARVMVPRPLAVTPEMSVRTLIDDYFLRRAEGAYPVVKNGTVLGVVGVEDVADLSTDRREAATVGEVMRQAGDVPSASEHESLSDVMARVDTERHERVLVVDGPRLVGLLDLGEAGKWADRVRDLGSG